MYIKHIKTLFKQWQCGQCRRCFDCVDNLDKHVKICNGGEIKHIWTGGMFNPPKNIKQCLFDFGFDVSNHDFLFLYLAVYGTEASLPVSDVQPAAKRAKMCNDLNANSVEQIKIFQCASIIKVFSLYKHA